MTFRDPSHFPFGNGRCCPPARNGCVCSCHRIPGIVHMVDCCQQFQLPITPPEQTPAEIVELLAKIRDLADAPAQESIPMSAVLPLPQDLKTKLDLLLDFNDQIAAVKTMVDRVKELTPDEVSFLQELLHAGTQVPSRAAAIHEPVPDDCQGLLLHIGDLVELKDKARAFRFNRNGSMGLSYTHAVVACLSPFVLVAPDCKARWDEVSVRPNELHVTGKADNMLVFRTRDCLTNEELVSTSEITRFEVR